MPHQCTNCGRSFADGSKQMLSGCPECGGNKFQFLPKRAVDGAGDTALGAATNTSPDVQSQPDEPDSSGQQTVTAQSTLESYPASSTEPGPGASETETAGPESDIIEAPPEPVEDSPDIEDRAQASARRSVVTDDELPPVDQLSSSDSQTAPNEDLERPDLSQLRQELNEQFESIKILQPGEYELNLMELYDRDEYIIALEEDGRYIIDVPDSWDDPE